MIAKKFIASAGAPAVQLCADVFVNYQPIMRFENVAEPTVAVELTAAATSQ